jgi:hypothetical protein
MLIPRKQKRQIAYCCPLSGNRCFFHPVAFFTSNQSHRFFERVDTGPGKLRSNSVIIEIGKTIFIFYNPFFASF